MFIMNRKLCLIDICKNMEFIFNADLIQTVVRNRGNSFTVLCVISFLYYGCINNICAEIVVKIVL